MHGARTRTGWKGEEEQGRWLCEFAAPPRKMEGSWLVFLRHSLSSSRPSLQVQGQPLLGAQTPRLLDFLEKAPCAPLPAWKALVLDPRGQVLTKFDVRVQKNKLVNQILT